MDKRWYIVHAYSNFENKVAESIREQAKQRGLTDQFEEVMVPKEKVTEVRRGRKVDTERKFFPGYELVKVDLTDEAYHLIKNTPKVTGFRQETGPSQGRGSTSCMARWAVPTRTRHAPTVRHQRSTGRRAAHAARGGCVVATDGWLTARSLHL